MIKNKAAKGGLNEFKSINSWNSKKLHLAK
jgi:hypothetical protein